MTRESFVARDEADLFRTGRGPRFVALDEVPYPPTHPLGHRAMSPRSIGVSLDVVEGGELAVEPRAVAPQAHGKPTPARVPGWVKDPAKWQSMTRAERRAVERHHRRQR